MLKSRSSGDSRSNSVESEEQQQRQPVSNQSPSDTPLDEYADATDADKNCLPIRNEPTIPNSPPPSYEYVLEETRMESTSVALRESRGRDEQKQIPNNEKSAGSAEGRDDDGGGPGGGDRRAVRVVPNKILHKSSKEFYKAMAKQWGITCKMSDHCRCLDCQSRYFDCDYDEHEKGDGGLSAGAPVFLSEVIHGTACNLL